MTLQDIPIRLSQWAPELKASALCYPKVDPMLLAAILDRESRGGYALKPPGPGGLGDGGHGHGLGQIDDRTHASFLAAKFDDGDFLWMEPAFAILYSARLLAKLLKATGGDEPVAVAAYNCGLRRAQNAVMQGATASSTRAERIAALDRATTGGDYVSKVLENRDALQVVSKMAEEPHA